MELELLWEGPLWFPWSWRYVQPPKWSSNRLRNDPNFYSRRPRNHPQLILGMEELLAQKARTDKIEGPSLLPFMPWAVSKYNWTWEKPNSKGVESISTRTDCCSGESRKIPSLHSQLTCKSHYRGCKFENGLPFLAPQKTKLLRWLMSMVEIYF